jgi:hypothetical protein
MPRFVFRSTAALLLAALTVSTHAGAAGLAERPSEAASVAAGLAERPSEAASVRAWLEGLAKNAVDGRTDLPEDLTMAGDGGQARVIVPPFRVTGGRLPEPLAIPGFEVVLKPAEDGRVGYEASFPTRFEVAYGGVRHSITSRRFVIGAEHRADGHAALRTVVEMEGVSTITSGGDAFAFETLKASTERGPVVDGRQDVISEAVVTDLRAAVGRFGSFVARRLSVMSEARGTLPDAAGCLRLSPVPLPSPSRGQTLVSSLAGVGEAVAASLETGGIVIEADDVEFSAVPGLAPVAFSRAAFLGHIEAGAEGAGVEYEIEMQGPKDRAPLALFLTVLGHTGDGKSVLPRLEIGQADVSGDGWRLDGRLALEGTEDGFAAGNGVFRFEGLERFASALPPEAALVSAVILDPLRRLGVQRSDGKMEYRIAVNPGRPATVNGREISRLLERTSDTR